MVKTTLRSEASYFGPSYMIDNLWHDYHGMTIESVLINCHYPVTPTSFLLQWGAIVPWPPGLSDAQAARVAAKFADFVGLGFQQDVEIWMHKSRVDNPLLCAEAIPVYQVRRWYEQFYRDVADIEPDMVARFEFEIDTTRPVAGWEAEVAQNLCPAGQMLSDSRQDERARERGPAVECAAPAARPVLAAKFSPQHTSVQWSAAAVRARCAEFGALAGPECAGRGVRQPAGQHRRGGGGRAARGVAALTREFSPGPGGRGHPRDRRRVLPGARRAAAAFADLRLPAGPVRHRPHPVRPDRFGGPVLLPVEFPAHCRTACHHRQAGLPAGTRRTGSSTGLRPGAYWTCCRRPGTFSPRSLDGDFVLFAAGSGITPVMSILKPPAGRGARPRGARVREPG